MVKQFEVFITPHTSRVAVVEATTFLDAYDRAFDLFPSVDYRHFLIVPITLERVLGRA